MKKFLPSFRLNIKNLFLPIILLSLTAFLFDACVKDNFEFDKMAKTEWNPEFALPLAKTSISMEDIVSRGDSSGYIKSDETKFITLIYGAGIVSSGVGGILTIKSILPLPLQYPSIPGTFDSTALVTQGSITYNGSFEMAYAATGTEIIDSMFLKSGRLNLYSQSTIKHNHTIKYTLPGLRKNGAPYSITNSVSNGSTSLTGAPAELAGYIYDLTKGSIPGMLEVQYQIIINYNSTQPVSKNDKITFTPSLVSLDYSTIYGFLGERSIPIRQTTPRINIFNNAISGKIHFVNPSISLKITNSFGFPLQAKFNKLTAVSDLNGSMDITGFEEINFLAPSIPGNDAVTNIVIDTTGNFFAAMESSPRYIDYDFVATANPGGGQTANFFKDDSRFKVDVEVILPLWGSSKTITFLDTFDFNIESFKVLESGQFNLNVTNTFPIDVGIQIYFVDSLYNIMDSLVEGGDKIIKSGLLDASGRVGTPTTKTTYIVFTPERFERLAKLNNKLLLKGSVATTDAGSKNVKFYSDYKIDVQIAAKAKLKAKI